MALYYRGWEDRAVKVFEGLEEALRVLEKEGVRRRPEDGELREVVKEDACRSGREFVDVSSNDYLGYSTGANDWQRVRHERRRLSGARMADLVVSRETDGWITGGRIAEHTTSEDPCEFELVDGGERLARFGGGASRLLGGSYAEHVALEKELAEWVKQPAAILFSSGYAANVGLLSALPQVGDTVFSDALNHASIVDGCRLGRADVVVYPHRDLEALDGLLRTVPCRGCRWVVSETYFSMDGDCPDLRRIREVCDKHDAGLILDEAHALGVYGDRGSGLAAAQNVSPDVIVGAFGKSIGLQGAFVAGPSVVKEWLWNKARSFVFSTATSPYLASLQLFHVKQIQCDDKARERLSLIAARIRERAIALGFALAPDSFGPILPILFGDNHRTLLAAQRLRRSGILVYPVRPPTVPFGTARLRVTLMATMSDKAVEQLLDGLAQISADATLMPRKL